MRGDEDDDAALSAMFGSVRPFVVDDWVLEDVLIVSFRDSVDASLIFVVLGS